MIVVGYCKDCIPTLHVLGWADGPAAFDGLSCAEHVAVPPRLSTTGTFVASALPFAAEWTAHKLAYAEAVTAGRAADVAALERAGEDLNRHTCAFLADTYKDRFLV